MECNAVNASLSLNLIHNNFLTFLTEDFPILDPYLPPKSENLRPHYSHSMQLRKCNPIHQHIPISLLWGSTPPAPPPRKLSPAAGHRPKLPAEILASITQHFFFSLSYKLPLFCYKNNISIYQRAFACKHPVITKLLQNVTTIILFSQSKPKLEPLIPTEHNF